MKGLHEKLIEAHKEISIHEARDQHQLQYIRDLQGINSALVDALKDARQIVEHAEFEGSRVEYLSDIDAALKLAESGQ